MTAHRTVHRHDYAADHPVSVDELINRVAGEGLPVRLVGWQDRIVANGDLSGGYAGGDWPTGELPRITDTRPATRPGVILDATAYEVSWFVPLPASPDRGRERR